MEGKRQKSEATYLPRGEKERVEALKVFYSKDKSSTYL